MFNQENIEVLTQPIVPIALHGVNPRTIMGNIEWGKRKKEWQAKANHHCMICGRYIAHKPGDWMALHERYEYDLDRLIQKFTGYIILCEDCHNYIHQGRMQILVNQGALKPEEYERVIEHGDRLLKEAGLTKIRMSKYLVTDPSWQLEFNGRLYNKSNMRSGGKAIS